MFQLNQASGATQSTTDKQQQDLNGFIANSPIYVTSIGGNGEAVPPSSAPSSQTIPNGHQDLPKPEPLTPLKQNHIPQTTPLKQLPINVNVEVTSVPSQEHNEEVGSPVPTITNGRTEKLIGEQPENRRNTLGDLTVSGDSRLVIS